MRINFKSFKKVRENNETATLKNGRGHEITLSKKSLRPHLLKELTQLPLHLAEGTQEVPEDPNEPIQLNNVPQEPGAAPSLQQPSAQSSSPDLAKAHQAVEMIHHAKSA